MAEDREIGGRWSTAFGLGARGQRLVVARGLVVGGRGHRGRPTGVGFGLMRGDRSAAPGGCPAGQHLMINSSDHLWLLGDMECSGILITDAIGPVRPA